MNTEDEDWLMSILIGMVIATLIGAGFAIHSGAQYSSKFQEICIQNDGHVRHIYKSGDLCIGRDGRIIEFEVTP